MHRRSLLPLCLMFVTLGACARQDAAPAAAPTAAAPAAPASTPAPTVSPLQPNAALSPELAAHLVRPHSPVIYAQQSGLARRPSYRALLSTGKPVSLQGV